MLLEAPFDPIRRQMNSVLLTIDLTKAVADEAIERKDCVVVAYRMAIRMARIYKVQLTRDRSNNLQRPQGLDLGRLSATVVITARA